MVPLGLWNDMRLPSFFSGVFFCPVSESKRGKVRITFMFPSPQLVTSCRFPAPWVDSSFVNSERASQPASDVSCERWTTFSLSLSLLPLSPSRFASTLLPSLSLYHTVLSLFLLPPRLPCVAMTAAETSSPCLPPRAFHSRRRSGRPPSGYCRSGWEPERRRWIQLGRGGC